MTLQHCIRSVYNRFNLLRRLVIYIAGVLKKKVFFFYFVELVEVKGIFDQGNFQMVNSKKNSNFIIAIAIKFFKYQN